ncbi:hypothetical protein AB1Y20_012260 [Prymnesium parvum]|uniref:REM2- and Rab-like small GTPase 1 n=1 Tax=Prymnesium parvum TaxID=97485 RepID=A0AB34IQQ8_PRYPA
MGISPRPSGGFADAMEGPHRPAAPPLPRDTHRALRVGVELRRRLGHGSTLNLRLLLRGDALTGKTSLFRRTLGLPATPPGPPAAPATEIGAAHVDWAPEWCEDRVKLEVWDVVDGAPREESKSLKAAETPPRPRAASLTRDAAGVDVYQSADAMVLLVDQRKRWTLEYAERRLRECPARLPVLLAANFSDLIDEGAAVAVEWEEIAALVAAEAERSGRSILATRCSMKDCTGLDVIHRFLDLAYHQSKRAALLAAAAAAAERHAEAHASLLDLLASRTPLPPPSSPAKPAPSSSSSSSSAQKDWLGRPIHRPAAAAVVPKLDAPPTPPAAKPEPPLHLAADRTPPTATPFAAPCDVIDESFFGADEPPPRRAPPAAAPSAANEGDDLLPLLDDPDEA